MMELYIICMGKSQSLYPWFLKRLQGMMVLWLFVPSNYYSQHVVATENQFSNQSIVFTSFFMSSLPLRRITTWNAGYVSKKRSSTTAKRLIKHYGFTSAVTFLGFSSLGYSSHIRHWSMIVRTALGGSLLNYQYSPLTFHGFSKKWLVWFKKWEITFAIPKHIKW